jgi:gliding motility-associated-like protein
LKTLLKLFFVLIVFFSATPLLTDAQVVGPPVLRCANVLPNSDVFLRWTRPADPAGVFFAYEIWMTDFMGNNTFIFSTINYNQTTFIHLGADACTAKKTYYMKTRYSTFNGLTTTDSSNFITTIQLTANTPIPYNGVVNLNWNHMSNPRSATHSKYYKIFMEYPAGVLNFIDSTKNTFYFDTVEICQATVNYVVSLADFSGCESNSCLATITVSDITPPHPVSIDSLTYDTATSQIFISWTPSISMDVAGCLIFQNDVNFNPPWVVVDTLIGRNNFSTFINPSWGDSTTFTYSVMCFDSCLNASVLSVPHKTIFLEYNFDRCNRSVQLKWNKYRGFKEDVDQYLIYESINGGNYQLITSNGPNDTVFVKTNLLNEVNYNYFIRVKQRNKLIFSRSNDISFFSSFPAEPQFLYLINVTLNDDNKIELNGIVDTTSGTFKLRVERKAAFESVFFKVAEIERQFLAGKLFTYIDNDADASNNLYTYRIIAVDSCNRDLAISNIGTNIFLKGENDNSNLINQLEWNRYQNWEGRIVSQQIYRSYNGLFETQPLFTLFDTTFQYVDNLARTFDANGQFCYYVVVNEGPTTNFNFRSNTKSNTVCLTQQSALFIPNAFTPFGLNRIFKPVFSFLSPNNYRFEIYDRYGAQVFVSYDTDIGWDGTIDGKIAKESIYIYHLVYSDSEGKLFEKRGLVTLIR